MSRQLILTATVSAIIGTAVGVALAYSTAGKGVFVLKFAETTATSMLISQFSAEQFNNADSEHAKAALSFELGILQQLERASSDQRTRQQLQAGIGYAYGHLGMIEEAAGHTENAQRAFGLARTYFNTAFPHPGQELTDDMLKKAVRLRDAAILGTGTHS